MFVTSLLAPCPLTDRSTAGGAFFRPGSLPRFQDLTVSCSSPHASLFLVHFACCLIAIHKCIYISSVITVKSQHHLHVRPPAFIHGIQDVFGDHPPTETQQTQPAPPRPRHATKGGLDLPRCRTRPLVMRQIEHDDERACPGESVEGQRHGKVDEGEVGEGGWEREECRGG